MKNLLLLITAALGIVACQSEDYQQAIDRQVRKKLSVLGGSTITELKLTQEKQDNLYFAEALMENGMPIQAMVLIQDDTVAVKETLNSAMLRRLSRELDMPCVSVVLKPVENSNVPNEFQGEAVFKTGDKIQFFAHEQLGWRPANDSTTLGLLTKKQMQKLLLEAKDSITLFTLQRTAVDTVYSGKYETQQGGKKEFSVTWSQTGFKWEINQPQQ